mgnify:FL=1
MMEEHKCVPYNMTPKCHITPKELPFGNKGWVNIQRDKHKQQIQLSALVRTMKHAEIVNILMCILSKPNAHAR